MRYLELCLFNTIKHVTIIPMILRFFYSLVLLFSLSYSVFAEPIVWKVHSHKPRGTVLFKNFKNYIVDPVNKAYPNEFKIQMEAVGDKTGYSNHGIFSATRHRRNEGHFSATMYWGNADPVFAIIGDLIGAWESGEDFNQWIKDENGIDYLRRAYNEYNMYFVDYSLGPHESIVSKVPIRNLDDIKGKVIRVPPGSMSEDFFQAAGAITRPLPMGKVIESLKHNRIDLADYSTLGINLSEGLYKNAKHTNYPGFHSLPIFEFVVNKDAWNSLPSKIRTLIVKNAEIWRVENQRILEKENKDKLALLQNHKVSVYKWDKAELKKAREIASKTWDKYAKKGPIAKEVIDSVRKWLKKNGKL